MGLLHRPRSTAEALAQMAAGPATLIAGGTDIFPALVDRPTPARLIDLSDIAELRGIEIGAKAIRIGAATTWSEIVGAELPPSCRMLQQAAREVVAVRRDLDLAPVDLTLRAAPADPVRFAELAEELNLGGSAERILAAMNLRGAGPS